jgi:ammonia channel protein AmtB
MIDSGNTAWLLTATALVLFMTLPGLALFYGGLVRAENLFVDAALGGAGLVDGRNMADQLAIQITGLIVVLLWSLVLSYVIAKAVQALTGLRVGSNTEEQGLDLRLHGERGYNI